MVDGNEGEGISPPGASADPPEQGSLTTSKANGSNAPAIVEQLTAINNTSSQELARLALGGEAPNEIVPTAEGITLFQGERARKHRASGAKKSLLAERLERIDKTANPKTDPPEPRPAGE